MVMKRTAGGLSGMVTYHEVGTGILEGGNKNKSRESDTSASAENGVAEVLLAKRLDIIESLQRIERDIVKINDAHAADIKALETRKKPLEDSLFHIEALLKIEGHEMERSPARTPPDRSDVSHIDTSINDAAYALLQQSHEPIHYKEIAERLQSRNVIIPGKNPSATLLSRISRDKRFKRAKKRGVYALSVWRTRSKHSGPNRKSVRTSKNGNAG
jgi:hypothetical protein